MIIYRGFSSLLGLLLIAVLAGGVIWYTQQKESAPTVEDQEVVTSAEKDPTPAPTAPSQVAISSSVITLTPGSKSGSMQLVSIRAYNETFGPISPTNVKAEFSGTAKVQGAYEYYFGEFDGEWTLSFTPVGASGLPSVNERSSEFYFSNQSDAVKMLGLAPRVAAKGTATIQINGYVLSSYPSEVRDRTSIISVE